MQLQARILILFICFYPFYGKPQDTIVLKNRKEFNQLIQYRFLDETGGLTPVMRKRIEKKFKKFDFSDNQYKCQYLFDYIIELDSTGYIKKCKQLGSFADSQLNEFSNGVVNIIINSKYQFPNRVNLVDTNYYIGTVQLTFELSCDPRELVFRISQNETSESRYVLYVKDEEKNIYFSDFSKYTAKKKKC